MKTINGIPRRIRMDLYTHAEKAIAAAVNAVEMAGADELLTHAVILLNAAKLKVAGYVETQELWQCPICGNVMTEDQSKGYISCPTGMHGAAHVRVECDKPSDKIIVHVDTENAELKSTPQVPCDDWLGGWNDVTTTAPPLRDWVSGLGWSEKQYVLAVDAKGRMSIGFATVHSSVPFMWTFAKSIGEPTHWRQLPKPPNSNPKSAGESGVEQT